MRDSDINESEYVGWASKPTNPSLGTIVDVTGWENISESIVMKKITVELVNNNKCHFHNSSPIICAVNVMDNQTMSEVSKMVYPAIQSK